MPSASGFSSKVLFQDALSLLEPNSARALAVVVPATSATGTPLISAIAAAATVIAAGSFRTSGLTPRTGESVSSSTCASGNRAMSFSFWRERTTDGGIEKS